MTTIQAPQPTLSRPRPAQPKTTFSFGRFLLALLAVLVWLSALAAVGGVVWYQYQHAGLIHQGVSVRSIDLSGMTLPQAQTVLEAAFDPYPMAPVTVRYGDQTWTLTAKDLGVNFDARSAAEAAFQVGRRPITGSDTLHQLAQLQANLQDQLAAFRFGHEGAGRRGGRPLGWAGLAGAAAGRSTRPHQKPRCASTACRSTRPPARWAIRWTWPAVWRRSTERCWTTAAARFP